MNYQFPLIRHLNDVRPAIEGRTEFSIAEREFGYVVNYHVTLPDSFPPVSTAGGSAQMREEQTRLKAIRRECRGIIFDRDGGILSRRLHKFFNVNEREETEIKRLDLSQPHVITEKLDGSMITPILFNDKVRWGTKMGLTDVSADVEAFVAGHPEYEAMARSCAYREMTPIFEWCSRKNKVVIDHPEDRLVLIAIRQTHSGEYLSYEDMTEFSKAYDIPVVKVFPGTVASMEDLIAHTRDIEEAEGYVLRFNNGHMVKIKSEWYVRIHKAKDTLTFEKDVLAMILDNKVDDVLPFVSEDLRMKLTDYQVNFWDGICNQADLLESDLNFYRKQACGDKKEFAIKYAPEVSNLTRNTIFKMWDAPRDQVSTRIMRHLEATVSANLGSQTKVDSIRELLPKQGW